MRETPGRKYPALANFVRCVCKGADLRRLKMRVEIKAPAEVKPIKRNPFQAPFSDKRRTEADCCKRRAPAGKEHHTDKQAKTLDSNNWTKPGALLEQQFPADWTHDERLLFTNWLEQVVRLQDTLTTIGKDRPRLLWRACKIYRKLGAALVRAAQVAERNAQKVAAAVQQ